MPVNRCLSREEFALGSARSLDCSTVAVNCPQRLAGSFTLPGYDHCFYLQTREKAERVGFEPTRRLNTAYAISNRAPSANSDTSPEATDGSLPCLWNVVEILLTGSVAPETRSDGFQRQGSQYAVDSELGPLPL